MGSSLFDELSRSLGAASSRRQALKTLLAITTSGALAWVGVGCDNDEENPVPTPDDNNPIPLSYEIATPEQIQTLISEAQQNENYRFLENLFEESAYESGTSEAITISREDEPTTRALITHIQMPNSAEEVLLAYGLNDDESPIVFSLKYNTQDQSSIGLYRDGKGTTAVEFIQSKPKTGVTNPSNTVSGACKVCTETCQLTNTLRQGACHASAVASGIRLGYALKAAWEIIADPAGALKEAADARSHMSAMEKAANYIERCKRGELFDCGESDNVCKEVCMGCNDASGSTCAGSDVCQGGQCLKYCENGFCHPSEVCSDGKCNPANNGCTSPYPYMGIYPGFGNIPSPHCCPIADGINCGAKVDGRWGGCCPGINTVCIPSGTGYACCLVGVDPLKRC